MLPAPPTPIVRGITSPFDDVIYFIDVPPPPPSAGFPLATYFTPPPPPSPPTTVTLYNPLTGTINVYVPAVEYI